ncbi:hypothetical protein EV1_023192 [Malus domestica]
MAATTGAGINGLNSAAFLCGGKRSQVLLSAAIVGSKVGGASPTPKRFIVVAAAAKKSWNPKLKAVTSSTPSGSMARGFHVLSSKFNYSKFVTDICMNLWAASAKPK